MSDNIEVLARRRMALVEQKDSIDEAIKAVDAQLLAAIEVGGNVEVDGQPAWSVRSGNRTWNEERAREVLPAQLLNAITVIEPRIDRTLARKVLPPALYEECTVGGKPYVAKASRR